MTPEQLLGLSVEQLEALTDEEANAIYAPYFNVTRPDFALSPEAKAQAVKTETKKIERNELADFVKMMGMGNVDLNVIMKKK